MISTSEKPFLRIAFSITRSSGIGLATVSRAANDAPCALRELDDVEVGLDRAERRRGRAIAGRCGRRHLPAGHAVDPVIEEQDGDVDVAPRGVDEVVAADRGAVAVARDDDHVQVRAGHLDAGGERQRAPVRRVQRVDVDVARRAR